MRKSAILPIGVVILALISGIATELSCYQCVDVTMQSDSEMMNDLMKDQPHEGCGPEDKLACSDSIFDTCTTLSFSYSIEQEGMTMVTNMKQRGCAASLVPQMSDQEAICALMEQSMAEAKATDFSCRLETCTTDFCNTHGGIADDHEQGEDEHDRYVSSGGGITVSLILITLTAVTLLN